MLFRLFHPKYFLISIGGSPILGVGTPLGSIGFINAIFEIKKQIEQGVPYTEGVIKKGMYYTASLEYKTPADYREEVIDGKHYRIINKTTNKWSV